MRPRRRWAERIFALVAFLLLALFNYLLPILFPDKKLNKTTVAMLSLAAGALILIYLIRRRPPKDLFLKEVVAGWTFRFKAETGTSIELVELKENGHSRTVPPELLLQDSAPSRLLIFFPKSDQEKNEMFGRIARELVARLSGEVVSTPGGRLLIPLVVEIRPDGTLDDAISAAVKDLIKEKDPEVLEAVKDWLENESLLVPLLDFRKFQLEDFNPWLQRSFQLLETIGAVMAMPASRDWQRLATDERFAVVEVCRPIPLHWIEQTEAELEYWYSLIQLKDSHLSRSDVRQGFASMAFAFLKLQLQNPQQYSFSPAQLNTLQDGAAAMAEKLPIWIEFHTQGAGAFQWSPESHLIRDYLVASYLAEKGSGLDAEICGKLNDDNRCFYVRPLVERFAPGANALTGFELLLHHQLALLAWNQNQEVDNESAHAMGEVLAAYQAPSASMPSTPRRFFDWTDLDSLLSRFIRLGASDLFQPPFRTIPSARRVRTILNSNASGANIAIALQQLTERLDLWEYFEAGEDLPGPALAQFANVPDIPILSRVAASILTAPHAVPLPKELDLLLSGPEFEKELAAFLSEQLLDDGSLRLIANRLSDTARQTGRSAADWFLPSRTGPTAPIAITRLRSLVLDAQNIGSVDPDAGVP